jgi:hypothetical protein
MPPPNDKAFLPNSAYFDSGNEPDSDALRVALSDCGFRRVVGPMDAGPCAAFIIMPPGEGETQLSPPGTAMRQEYDLSSQIMIMTAHRTAAPGPRTRSARGGATRKRASTAAKAGIAKSKKASRKTAKPKKAARKTAKAKKAGGKASKARTAKKATRKAAKKPAARRRSRK